MRLVPPCSRFFPLLLPLLFAHPVLAHGPDVPRRPGFVVIHDGDPRAAVEVLDAVRDRGGWHLHLLPSGVLAGELPADLAGDNLGPPGRVTIHFEPEAGPASVPGPEAGDLPAGLTSEQRHFLEAWRGACREPVEPVFDQAAMGDPVVSPAAIRATSAARDLPLQDEEPERLPNQNSELMMGRVVANVLLPEAGGGPESWTQEQVDAVRSAAVRGWVTHGNLFPYVPLEVVYNVQKVPVGIEASHWPGPGDAAWILETMSGVGIETAGLDSVEAVHAYNNLTRVAFGTDWAYTAFVADASESPGHLLASSNGAYVGYARLGGPYLVTPHPAGDYGTGGFEHFLYRLTLQCFFALGESAGPGARHCDWPSGYLATKNHNSFVEGNPGVYCDSLDCVMREVSEDSLSVCSFTAGQIGVTDRGDRVPLVWSAPPHIEFDGGALDTLIGLEGTISGTVTSTAAVSSRNPFIPAENRIPWGPPLFQGFYEQNQTPHYFKPDDGRWNGRSEHFSVNVGSLVPGSNNVEFTFSNSVGVRNPFPYVKDVFVIGINFNVPLVETFDGRNKVRWTVAGIDFDAAYTLYRRQGAAGDWVEMDGTLEEREIAPGLKEFLYWDRDVAAGEVYSYRARGEFSLEYEGTPTDFAFDSPERTVYAQAPLGSGTLSSVLPNPMRDHGLFSVEVPLSYSEGFSSGSGSRRAPGVSGLVVPTPTEVAVYDVRGERVKTIVSRGLYGGHYTWTWDGTDDRGRRVGSGIYFLRFEAGNATATRKVVVVY